MISQSRIDKFNANLAKILREERSDKGISMTRLAEQAGLSQSTISLIENGKRHPTADALKRICEALDTTLWRIVQRAEESA